MTHRRDLPSIPDIEDKENIPPRSCNDKIMECNICHRCIIENPLNVEKYIKSGSKDFSYWKNLAKQLKAAVLDWKEKAAKATRKHNDLLKKRSKRSSGTKVLYSPKLYSDKTCDGKRMARIRIKKLIKYYIGPRATAVELLSDLIAKLPVSQIFSILDRMDTVTSVSRKTNHVYSKKPVSRWVKQKLTKAAVSMENDPALITTVYIARKRCELGRHLFNIICKLLFRNGSQQNGVSHDGSGRFRFAALEYGWDNSSQPSSTCTQIGLVMPRFSVGFKFDRIAREYIQSNAQIFPKVLSNEQVEVLLGISIPFDKCIAVIDIEKAIQVLLKLSVEVCGGEFTWFTKKSLTGNVEVDYGLFKMLTGVDCTPLYQGYFSKKALTVLSMACLNTPGLVCSPDWNIPLALVEGPEGDPFVDLLIGAIDKKIFTPMLANGLTVNFKPCHHVKANDQGAPFEGAREVRIDVTGRTDQSALSKVLKCGPPGARFGIAAVQVRNDELKKWALMISQLKSDVTRAFIEFDSREKMAQCYVNEAEEMKEEAFEKTGIRPKLKDIIDKLLNLAANDKEFGGHSQVYGMPYESYRYFILCVLHLDNNECQSFLLALVDASVRRYQARQGINVDRSVDQLDYDDIDINFNDDDMEKIDDSSSSVLKLISFVEKSVQPKMAYLIKEMLSPSKHERDEARSVRFIGKISSRFFHVLPEAVLCLIDSDETVVEKCYREQIYAQAHYLRCLSSLYHKPTMHRDLDDQALFHVGLLYHKLVSLCDLDCAFNTYNSCKTLPYMCLKDRDRYTPAFNPHVFLGPGLAGIMQAIEALNKLIKSRLITWTSGRGGFLGNFLSNFYELLVGQYDVLKKAISPSRFFRKAEASEPGNGKGFRFPEYNPNKNMCYTCRRAECNGMKQLSVFRADLLKNDAAFSKVYEQLPLWLESPKDCSSALPEMVPMTLATFMADFLLFDDSKQICEFCFVSYQITCKLLVTNSFENLSDAAKQSSLAAQLKADEQLLSTNLPRRKKPKRN